MEKFYCSRDSGRNANNTKHETLPLVNVAVELSRETNGEFCHEYGNDVQENRNCILVSYHIS